MNFSLPLGIKKKENSEKTQMTIYIYDRVNLVDHQLKFLFSYLIDEILGAKS